MPRKETYTEMKKKNSTKWREKLHVLGNQKLPHYFGYSIMINGYFTIYCSTSNKLALIHLLKCIRASKPQHFSPSPHYFLKSSFVELKIFLTTPSNELRILNTNMGTIGS